MDGGSPPAPGCQPEEAPRRQPEEGPLAAPPGCQPEVSARPPAAALLREGDFETTIPVFEGGKVIAMTYKERGWKPVEIEERPESGKAPIVQAPAGIISV